MKTCTKCGVHKINAEFPKIKSGLSAICKKCQKKYNNAKNMPSKQEVSDYFYHNKIDIDPCKFYNYYNSNGRVWQFKNGDSVKSWKQCLSTWQKHNGSFLKDEQSEVDLLKKRVDDLEKKIESIFDVDKCKKRSIIGMLFAYKRDRK